MTKIKYHPTLRRIKRKLLIESALLTSFLLVYWDWFDGADKPLYANVLLVTGIMLFVGNDVRMYQFMQRTIQGENIKKSLETFVHRLRTLAHQYIAYSVVYALVLIIFFTSVINMNPEKYWLLAGLLCTYGVLIYRSYRHWMKQVRQIQQTLEEF